MKNKKFNLEVEVNENLILHCKGTIIPEERGQTDYLGMPIEPDFPAQIEYDLIMPSKGDVEIFMLAYLDQDKDWQEWLDDLVWDKINEIG
jgi:hypothetical protein